MLVLGPESSSGIVANEEGTGVLERPLGGTPPAMTLLLLLGLGTLGC